MFSCASIRRTGLGLVAAALTGGAASAATVAEADLGAFSSSWTNPTVISAGTTSVSGSSASGRFDTFAFTGLTTGATSLVFDFSLASIGNSYSNGGGDVYFSTTPFAGGYYNAAGTSVYGGTFGVVYNPWNLGDVNSHGTSKFTLNLSDSFAGTVYVALDFTYGATVNYTFSVPALIEVETPVAGKTPTADLPLAELPADEALSAVPVPAAAPLLLGALALLGAAARRRKSA